MMRSPLLTLPSSHPLITQTIVSPNGWMRPNGFLLRIMQPVLEPDNPVYCLYSSVMQLDQATEILPLRAYPKTENPISARVALSAPRSQKLGFRIGSKYLNLKYKTEKPAPLAAREAQVFRFYVSLELPTEIQALLILGMN